MAQPRKHPDRGSVLLLPLCLVVWFSLLVAMSASARASGDETPFQLNDAQVAELERLREYLHPRGAQETQNFFFLNRTHSASERAGHGTQQSNGAAHTAYPADLSLHEYRLWKKTQNNKSHKNINNIISGAEPATATAGEERRAYETPMPVGWLSEEACVADDRRAAMRFTRSAAEVEAEVAKSGRGVLTLLGGYGRANNRLIVLAHAYEVALRLNAVLVVDPYLLVKQGNVSITRWYRLESVFDPARLVLMPDSAQRRRLRTKYTTLDTLLLQHEQRQQQHDEGTRAHTTAQQHAFEGGREATPPQQGKGAVMSPQGTGVAAPFPIRAHVGAGDFFFYVSPEHSAAQRLEGLHFSCEVRRVATRLPLLDEHARPTQPFVGVHLRGLEQQCDKWSARSPSCHLHPRLVSAVLSHLAADFYPLYVATDHQQPQQLNALHYRGAVSALGAPRDLDMALDQYVLTQAAAFIGNPVSTLSLNVCRFRHHHGCFFFHPEKWENEVDDHPYRQQPVPAHL
jgi:hypothetical protein